MYRKVTRKIHRKLIIRPGETDKYVIQRNKPVSQCPKCGKPGKSRYVKHGPKGGNVGRYYPCVVHYDPELYKKQKETKGKGNGTVFHYYHWWYERDLRYTKRPVDVRVSLADINYLWTSEYAFPEKTQEAIKKGRVYNQLHGLKPLD